ncbi:hypothetical protein L484_015604 [Morus notabilis]|uniref:Uncharacterized protein n=1 Tax=Morus notabilis TaxID=981085 RepID=W9QYC4_9ROSA|nr:hypothetical protein L484_015604 [Morus notabilis]
MDDKDRVRRGNKILTQIVKDIDVSIMWREEIGASIAKSKPVVYFRVNRWFKGKSISSYRDKIGSGGGRGRSPAPDCPHPQIASGIPALLRKDIPRYEYS